MKKLWYWLLKPFESNLEIVIVGITVGIIFLAMLVYSIYG